MIRCIVCGGPVTGWYVDRWKHVYDGPVCQQCWEEDFYVPGYDPGGGGVNYPEEAEPAFHIIRRQMIENLHKKPK